MTKCYSVFMQMSGQIVTRLIAENKSVLIESLIKMRVIGAGEGGKGRSCVSIGSY